MGKHLFVDLSHWQGEKGLSNAAWLDLKRCGVTAAIIKATQGTGHVDRAFSTNLRRARRHGFLVGAYHFSDAQPGKAQAQHFLRTVKQANGGNLKNLLLVMDVERNPGAGGNPKRGTIANFAKHVQTSAKRNTLLCYTAQGYWQSIGNPQLSHLFDGLWQARWDGKRHTCKAPNLPPKPPRAGFGGWPAARFWQFGMYRYKGKSIDGNAFYGSLAKMRELFMTEAPNKPDPEPLPPPDPEQWREEYNAFIGDAEAAVAALTPEGAGATEAKADALAVLSALEIEGMP